MNWGDMLCGVEVTPESWRLAYGIEEIITLHGRLPWGCQVGQWVISPWLAPRLTRPIFPPRGWAGKADAELWAELTHGSLSMDVGTGVPLIWNPPYSPHVYLRCSERLGSLYHNCGSIGIAVAELPALIAALQHAQVLSARLTEEQQHD